MEKHFKHACWLALRFACYRYLMACTSGRADGVEKAMRHIELCEFYVATFFSLPDRDAARREHEEDFQRVHDDTQALTDHLDEEIGFPVVGRPDYDLLAPLFFERFHAIATATLYTPEA